VTRFTSGARVGALVAVSAALALVTACGHGGGGSNDKVKLTSSHGHVAPASQASVTLQPPPGTQNVAPNTPVVVKATSGTLASVAVTGSDNKPLKGALSADKTSWTSSSPLGYGETYNVQAEAQDKAGKAKQVTGQFATFKPTKMTMPRIIPNGGTWGVGKSLIVTFDEAIKDKAAAERALTVTTSPTKLEGSWHWFSSKEVHWRPKTDAGTYWPAHTHVTVTANVLGVDLGGGMYGQTNKVGSFDIGDSHVAVSDDATHQMQVFVNGAMVKQIPVSMGQHRTIEAAGKSFDLRTHSGPHVVTEKFATKHMDSSTFGLPNDSQYGYVADLPFAVRISDAGEFVHVNANTVRSQGHNDVSHGCINVSPENGQWFYNLFGPGDVVDVHGTGLALEPSDGHSDWVIPWTTWVAGSALN
jgi:lipoprotein-anchoring transpeptidase ErfK/SrfK